MTWRKLEPTGEFVSRLIEIVAETAIESITRLLGHPTNMRQRRKSEKILAFLSVDKSYRDGLPIIPAESRVEKQSILRRIDIVVTIARDGIPLQGVRVTAMSNVLSDIVTQPEPTDSKGMTSFRVESRKGGIHEFRLTSSYPEFDHKPIAVSFGKAWYESKFYITAYNVCHEDDFRGEPVDSNGLHEKHRDDFLFSGKGVCMQGSGQTSDGRYIRITNPSDLKWENGFRRITRPEDAIFEYGLGGAFRPVEEGVSIAVDPKVIPSGHWVSIERVGIRRADDIGGGIDDHHIDVFMGGGKEAMQEWAAQGGNIGSARVLYLGRNQGVNS